MEDIGVTTKIMKKKYNYWDDLIEELKYERRTGMRSMIVDEAVRIVIVVLVVGLLAIILIK